MGTITAFAHAGDDINDSSSWLAGLSYLHARSDKRDTGGDLFSGTNDLGIASLVYKWAPGGNPIVQNLVRAAARLAAEGGAGTRLSFAAVVEREAEALLAERHPERNLRANVEFYTAVLLEAVGIPRALFSPTFAASRVAGWCAHYDEQRRRGRLMRPLSNYIGPRPGSPPR